MRRVVITGASGFIGYHLAKELDEEGVEVYGICRPGSVTAGRLAKLEHVRVIECPLDGIISLPEKLKARDYDAFYHLAWEGATGPLRSDFATQTDNIKWTGMAAETAKHLGCRKFIAASTVCELQCPTILQLGRFLNSSLYLLSKRAAYELTGRLCLKLELPLVWCVFYHPIGKYNKENQLMADTIKKLMRGEPPKFGSGDNWFDVIHVEDLAHGFALAGDRRLSGDWYYIGSENPRKLKDYLKRTGELIAQDVPLLFSYYQDDGLPMEKEWLDTSAFSEETGYRAEHSFDEAVLSTRDGILDHVREEESR